MMENEISEIKKIRIEYKLTQKRLSEITGIPKRTIEDWELFKRIPAPYMPDLIRSKIEKETK